MDSTEPTFRQEFINLIREKSQDFWNWLKPNKSEAWYLQTIKLILKLPIVMFMTLISPILFVILAIIFIIII